MNTTSNATELHPVNEHWLSCTFAGSGDGRRIVEARVYADVECKQFIGLIQAGNADGGTWLVSVGGGWIRDVRANDVYDAIDVLAELRSDMEVMEGRLTRLWEAANTQQLRDDVRGLVRDLAGGRLGGPAARLAAANVQYDL